MRCHKRVGQDSHLSGIRCTCDANPEGGATCEEIEGEGRRRLIRCLHCGKDDCSLASSAAGFDFDAVVSHSARAAGLLPCLSEVDIG